MNRPGDRLRALASYVFDAETMERLVDPVVADLQLECAEASRTGQVWRRRWLRTAACAAILYVAARSSRVFFTLTAIFTALLEVPYLWRWRFAAGRPFYLLPQALVIAVPIAMTLAIAWASRPASRSRRTLTATIASGAVCAIFMFVTVAWVLPAANQAFRVSVARENGLRGEPAPGLPEMTIGELRHQLRWASQVRADWRELEFHYYWRWAFPWASLSLALLLVALGQGGLTRRFLRLSSIPILFGYYVLMFFGRRYALHSLWPSIGGAWMPNVVTVIVAAAIAVRARRFWTISR